MHRYAQCAVLHRHFYVHRSLARKLDGVAHQVQKDLAEAARIALPARAALPARCCKRARGLRTTLMLLIVSAEHGVGLELTDIRSSLRRFDFQ